MAKTSAEIMQMLVDNNVKFVDLRFTDFKGKEQHVSVPVSAFDEDKFEEGHAFDGSSIAGWKGIEASDMLLMPDPDSARMDPFADEDIPQTTVPSSAQQSWVWTCPSPSGMMQTRIGSPVSSACSSIPQTSSFS